MTLLVVRVIPHEITGSSKYIGGGTIIRQKTRALNSFDKLYLSLGVSGEAYMPTSTVMEGLSNPHFMMRVE